jgi:YbbR domain-containing protein
MVKRDWITKDFGWKLFSLILAVAFWIAIRHNVTETPTTVMPFASVDTVIFTNLPVYAVSASADVHNAQVAPGAVAVQLSGPSEIMAVLEENKVHAVVNLTGIDAARGSHLPVDVSAPPGVAVNKVDPPKVGVTFSPPTE